MISTIVLIISLLLILLVTGVVGRAIVKKQQIIGRPPIPVVYFLICPLPNMMYLGAVRSFKPIGPLTCNF